MTVPPRISIVTLAVVDVAASTAFYESLGWRRSSSSNEDITFIQTDGPVLSLYQRAALADDAGVPGEGSGFRGVTLALNCATADEVDAVYDAWVAAGARPVKSPEKASWGGYSSYVADPDGHLWELAHNPYSPIGPDGRLVIGAPVE